MGRGLTKRYGKVVALDNCDFDLYPGEILAVIGDNGAGKSTLIKAVSGAVVPDEGEILLDGQQVALHQADRGARRRHRDGLPDPRHVAGPLDRRQHVHGPRAAEAGLHGPVAAPARPAARWSGSPARSSPSSGLMTIQNINQAVETLSGGQRQGVAVARAAAFGSKVVILDEPTAALGVKEIARACSS